MRINRFGFQTLFSSTLSPVMMTFSIVDTVDVWWILSWGCHDDDDDRRRLQSPNTVLIVVSSLLVVD